MLSEQLCRRIQFRRKLAVIPNIYLIWINADLDGITARIVLMNDGVQDNFPECILMKHILFDAMDSFVSDKRFEIFRINKIHNLIRLQNQRTVNLILITQIRIGIFKITDFHICARHPLFRIAMKRQHGGSRQCTVIIQEMKIVEKNLPRNIDFAARKPSAPNSFILEIFYRRRIQIFDLQFRQWNSIPCHTLLFQD